MLSKPIECRACHKETFVHDDAKQLFRCESCGIVIPYIDSKELIQLLDTNILFQHLDAETKDHILYDGCGMSTMRYFQFIEEIYRRGKFYYETLVAAVLHALTVGEYWGRYTQFVNSKDFLVLIGKEKHNFDILKKVYFPIPKSEWYSSIFPVLSEHFLIHSNPYVTQLFDLHSHKETIEGLLRKILPMYSPKELNQIEELAQIVREKRDLELDPKEAEVSVQ